LEKIHESEGGESSSRNSFSFIYTAFSHSFLILEVQCVKEETIQLGTLWEEEEALLSNPE